MTHYESSEKFSPFIWALVEREIPSPVFVVAYTGARHWLYTGLGKDICDLDFEDQIKLVSEAILVRQCKFAKTPFGTTLGYVFIREPDEMHEFRVDGRYLGPYNKRIPHLVSFLRIDEE